MARQLRVSSLTVSRWELGLHLPLPHYREQLCRLYGLTAKELGLAPNNVATPGDGAEPGQVAGLGDGPDERARRDLLDQVRRYWVDTELEDAAGSLPLLDLALVDRPGAVDDPRAVSARARRDRPLPRGTGIGEAYRRLGEQLLVLGDTGAGKTTLLLQLASELLSAPGGPMPVVFHLASWMSERRPLARWLADELHQRYGVARPLAQRWIAEGQVLPLLDGLDEVADRRRVACIEAINEFRREHGQLPMAVCCRTAWYEAAGIRLSLRGAVEIQPLPWEDVHRYLVEAGPELAGLRAAADEDQPLRELLTTPLFLHVAAITYRDRPAEETAGATLEDRRRHILRDYVDAMFARVAPSSSPPPERTLGWLCWLAASMRAHDQSVFYLDWLQPSWLPNVVHRWLVTHGVTLAIGLSTGAIAGLNWGADWGFRHGRVAFALIGVTIGLLLAIIQTYVTHEPQIVPAERLRWSWAALRRGLPGWLRGGLALGLAAGLVYGLMVGVLFDLYPHMLSHRGSTPPLAASLLAGALPGLVCGAWIGLLITLAFGLLSGLAPRAGVTQLIPGGSLRASGRNALVGGAVGGIVFGVGFAVFFGMATARTGPLAAAAAHALGLPGLYWPGGGSLNDFAFAALLGGVVAGLQRGGGAYLRHRVMLGLLVFGGFAPRDYVGFLEHATRLVLLKRRGAGYEFVHRLVQDHLADLAPTIRS